MRLYPSYGDFFRMAAFVYICLLAFPLNPPQYCGNCQNERKFNQLLKEQAGRMFRHPTPSL